MLSACRTSREVILSTHTAYIEDYGSLSRRKIRLDPNIDTLVVMTGNSLPGDRTEYDNNQSLGPFSEIRRVAWGKPVVYLGIHVYQSVLKLFPKLEIFFVVLNSEQILECYEQGCDVIFAEDEHLIPRSLPIPEGQRVHI
jgi:hypothetical protein